MKNGERIMNSISKTPARARIRAGASTGTLARTRNRAGANARTRALTCTFALALLVSAACLLAGCSGSSSTVPGHYSISEQSISASEASNPQDVIIVTAASQGQAFKLPVSALSHAMAAIESESYVGYLVSDGSDLRGKVYAGTKNSERAKEDELSSFKADYLRAACDARDATGNIDLLAALNKAVGQLNARSGDGVKTICVVSSGLANTGLLATSQELLAADPQAAIDQLREIGAISDYRGITVIFYGLGQSTGNQAIPVSAKKSLENLYAGIVKAGGGEAVVATDALEAIGCDEENLSTALEGVDTTYYAVSCNSYAYATVGGLNVDANMNVLREDGTPITNLFAVGQDSEGVCNVDGKAYTPWGGQAQSWTFVSGQIAGQQAAAVATAE